MRGRKTGPSSFLNTGASVVSPGKGLALLGNKVYNQFYGWLLSQSRESWVLSPKYCLSKLLARGRGVYLIAASTQVKPAYEVKELGHGVLTYVLLDGLGEKGPPRAERNGMVTVEYLIPYVKEQVPELTEKYLKERQQPVTVTTGTDFPLAVK
jgi:hypothetical protein